MHIFHYILYNTYHYKHLHKYIRRFHWEKNSREWLHMHSAANFIGGNQGWSHQFARSRGRSLQRAEGHLPLSREATRRLPLSRAAEVTCCLPLSNAFEATSCLLLSRGAKVIRCLPLSRKGLPLSPTFANARAIMAAAVAVYPHQNYHILTLNCAEYKERYNRTESLLFLS